MIRIANFLTNAGVIDVYVDGQLAIADVNPNAVSDWFQMPSGNGSISITPADTSLDEAFLGPFNVDSGRPVTIAITGSGDAQNFDWTALRESITFQEDQAGANQLGNVRITLVNSSEGLGDANVQMTLVQPFVGNADAQAQQGQTNQSGTEGVQTFGAGSFFDLGPATFGADSSFFNVPAGLYNIQLVPTTGFGIRPAADTSDQQMSQSTSGNQVAQIFGSPDPRLNLAANWPSFSNVALNANSSYLFAVTQNNDGLPWLVIQSSNVTGPVNAQGQVSFANQANQASTTTTNSPSDAGTTGTQGTQDSSGQTGTTYP
jgi:hypothetical protein